VKRISWSIAAALIVGLFLPVSAVQAGTTTEACVSGSAILSYPRPLAMDKSGNLFFVDQNNFVIRKVLRGSRSVVNATFDDTSVAGQALKNELQGYRGGNMRLGLDASGNLFIAIDSGWMLVNYIFKLAPSGIVSVVAGTGTDGYTGDGGLATAATIHDPSGLAIDDSGNIYISDNSANVIRKINASDGKINTVVGPGATFPELSQPGPLALDSSGQLFIATGNGLILKRAAGGNVSVFAGSESNPISARSIAVDGKGTVSYLESNAIFQINPLTKVITKIAGGTLSVYPGNSLDHRLDTAHTIAADSSGNVYVSDSNQFLIYKIDPSTLTISNYVGVPRYLGTGNRYIPTDGTLATHTSYRYTIGLAASSNGDFYFSANDSYNTVVKVSKLTGLITNIAGDLTSIGGFTADGAVASGAKLDNTGSVAIDASGNVFFLDLGNYRLRKIKASDGKIVTIAGTDAAGYSASDSSPASSPITAGGSDKIAVDSLGNVYLTDNAHGVIRRITDGANPRISNIASGFPQFTGLSVDSINNFLYFSTDHQIKKIDLSSPSPAVTPVATLQTDFVRALAIDPTTQTLYYGNQSPEPENKVTIGKIVNASTAQTTILAGPTSLVAGGGSLNYVSAGAPATSVRLGYRIELAFSSGTSTLYVSHEFNVNEGDGANGFQAINVSTGTISTVSGIALDGPAPLCVEYETVPTITAGNGGSQAAAIPARASSAVFASPSIANATLSFITTSSTASATVTPVSVNPAPISATPFTITGSTKIVDIQVTGITGSVTVCLDGASTDHLYHYTGTPAAWVELGSRSYANGQVCGVTTSFSPFAAAAPALIAAPAFTLNQGSEQATVGKAISGYTIASTGGAIASYSISPAIGNGLTFNTSTGLISGTPTASAVAVTYTITGTNSGSSVSTTYRITVNAAPVMVPDPLQQSKITSISASTAIAGTSTPLVISGSFVEKISAIQINGVALAAGSWSQTATSVSFTLPGKSAGTYQIQLFNGSAPVLKVQSFTFTAPIVAATPTPTPNPTAKAKVIYIRCVKAGRGTRIAYGVNPVCPAGFTRQ